MISFSIITVTFNAEQVVQRTLESVSHQSYQLVEHVIIDNCSTDNTLELCRQYKENNEGSKSNYNVTIISEPDKGLYDAMNKGIGLANSDYIIFLNAGDSFPQQDTLETIAYHVGEGEELPSVLYGDTELINQNGEVVGKRQKRPPKTLTWRSFKRGMLVCHQAFYARTDIAKTTLYNLKYRYSSDVDWCIRIMKKAEQQNLPIRFVGTVIAQFLVGGATTTHQKESLCERFEIMKYHYGLAATLLAHILFTFQIVLKSKVKMFDMKKD